MGAQEPAAGVQVPPIVHKTLVRASPEATFEILATASGFDRWFTHGMTLEEHPGGEMIFRWKNWGAERVTTESKARVVAYERPRRFAFEWWLDAPTIVELAFSEDPEGTIVTVTETGYRNDSTGLARCLDCATGWGEALTLAKFHLEHELRY